MNDKKRIVFTGGGTGGHVYPALALIEKLDQNHYDLHWVGSSKGMERAIVEDYGIPYHGIPCGKLRRYFSFENFTDIFKIIGGFFASLIVLSKLKPDLIFSKGGFVTVPPLIAASLLKIPSFTHDSDIGPGLATRLNSRFVKKIFVPVEQSIKYFKPEKRESVVVTGNPVRSALLNGDSQK